MGFVSIIDDRLVRLKAPAHGTSLTVPPNHGIEEHTAREKKGMSELDRAATKVHTARTSIVTWKYTTAFADCKFLLSPTDTSQRINLARLRCSCQATL